MVETAAVYRRLVGAKVRSQLEYRTSFALNTLGSLAATLLDFFAIAVLFGHLPALAGWSFAQVAVLYGMSGVSFAITDLVVGHFDRFGELIRLGEFDILLVRPLGSLFQVVAADFQLRRIGKMAQAGTILVVALVNLHLAWSVARIVVLVSAIVSGAAIFGAVWTIGISACFWTTETTEMNNAFTYGGNFLTSYPIELYGTWVRRLLAFAVPMAFVNYYPALYVLGRADPFHAPYVVRFLSPVVAVAVVVVANVVWRFAVRHYRSTGS